MNIVAFILAGGRGDRVHGPVPKIELDIAGLPCFQHLLNTVSDLKNVKPFLIASPHFARSHQHDAIQETPRGTGDAVRVACDTWGSTPPDTVLILYADVPLIRPETLTQALKTHHEHNRTLTLLSFRATLPNSYGRIVEDPQDPSRVLSIIDAADEQRDVFGSTLAHSGIMIVKGEFLWEAIRDIKPDNAQKEYYLTDIVAIAAQQGHHVHHCPIVKEDAQGLNTWSDWVILENIFQTRARSYWFANNALVSSHVKLHHDTQLSAGVVIEPFVTIGPGVSLESNVHIASFCHLSDCLIKESSRIGPFAHVHKNSVIGAHNTLGNFVECVRSTTQDHVKAKHLNYIGDTTIDEHTNIGAGAVFVNYDGHKKHKSSVGKNVLIGANTSLIAPLTIGHDSIVGAGSTITQDVPDKALAVERSAPVVKEEGATRYHQKRTT